jgi:hypothetical protein
MHKKEFWILTIKCRNKLKHEMAPLGPHLLVKSKIRFDACVKKGCSAPLTIAREKQT